MRLPLAVSIESRNGSVTKDCVVKNGIAESKGQDAPPILRKRPGLIDLGLIHAGTAQLLAYWAGKVRAVLGDTLNIVSGVTGQTLTWSSMSLPSSAQWQQAGSDGTNFVAVVMTNNGTTTTSAAYSTNGSTWNAVTLPASIDAHAVCSDGSATFVIVGNPGASSGSGMRSTDHGVTFSAVTLPTIAVSWGAACYSSSLGKFLAIAQGATNTALSSDGSSWSAGGSMPAAQGWEDVCYGNGLFVAVGDTGSSTLNIATSPDGQTWTSRAHTSGLTFNNVAWNGHIFVAMGGAATYLTSVDGITWVSRTSPGSSVNQVRAGNGVFVATNSAGTTAAYTSTDGISWSTSTLINSSSAIAQKHTLATNGAGTWIALRGNVSSNLGNVGTFGTSLSTSTTSLSPTSPDLQFSAQDNGSNAPNSQLMIKNATQAWTLNASDTLTQITDVDYPGTYTVTLTSLTRSGTTATATTASDTNFQVGSAVTIAGATPSGYNGAVVITGIIPAGGTVVGPYTITITRSGTTATATTVTEPHSFTNGQSVTISGSDQAEYNGTFTITYLSPTSFSFTVTVSNAAITTPATGSPTLLDYVSVNITNSGTAGITTFHATYNLPIVEQLANAETFVYGGAASVSGSLPAGTYTVANSTSAGFDFTVSTATVPSFALYALLQRSVPPTVSSIAASNGVATLTTSAAHGYQTGKRIYVRGATQGGYNVSDTAITVTSTTTFTYPLAGFLPESPATPATGTISAQANSVNGSSFTYAVVNTLATPATGTITAAGGRNTVPGIAYLDGYFVVMDVNGVLYNSAEDDPSTWNALEYVTALAETGAGKAIARSLNYIVAFKEWSTELFWDANNPPPGSPLGPVDDGLILIGCASGDSVTPLDGAIYWVSQVRQRGRSVHVIQGRTVQKVSTPDVERILNADDLATVRAAAWKVDGHPIYLLTLETSNLTLAYDGQSQTWGLWSSYTLNGFSVSVSSITRSGTTATVTTATAHGLSDGDPVKIAGASQSDYNGVFQAFVLSATTFTIEVANSPTTPATGTITATAYTESYFKFTKYTDANGIDVVLHETDGHLYQVSSSTYQDNGIPINRFVRTIRLDGGSENYKTMPLIRMVADKGTGTPAVRWSDDDSTSFVAYRKLDLSLAQPEARRCGKFRRRSIEIRDLSNTGERWEAAEIEIGGQ